jgi:hypothetical protein
MATDIDELCDEIADTFRVGLGEKFKALLQHIHDDTEGQKDTDDGDGDGYAQDNTADEDYTADEARDHATDAYNAGWSDGFDRAIEILAEVIENAQYLGWIPAPRVSEPAAPTAAAV